MSRIYDALQRADTERRAAEETEATNTGEPLASNSSTLPGAQACHRLLVLVLALLGSERCTTFLPIALVIVDKIAIDTVATGRRAAPCRVYFPNNWVTCCHMRSSRPARSTSARATSGVSPIGLPLEVATTLPTTAPLATGASRSDLISTEV